MLNYDSFDFNPTLNSKGIYGLICVEANKIYVGSSSNKIGERKSRHFRDLKNNTHYNLHLQRIYNKYGKENIIFAGIETLKNVSREQIIEREKYWITFFKDFCLNQVTPIPVETNEECILRMLETRNCKGYIVQYKKDKPFIVLNLSKFAKENDLNVTCLQNVAKGKASNHQGWHVVHNDPEKAKLYEPKLVEQYKDEHGGYTINSPDGTIYQVNSLSSFCKINDVSRTSLLQVARGESHKTKTGWQCEYTNPEIKAKYKPKQLKDHWTELAAQNTYYVITPDNLELTINDLKAFSDEHNLNYRVAYNMSHHIPYGGDKYIPRVCKGYKIRHESQSIFSVDLPKIRKKENYSHRTYQEFIITTPDGTVESTNNLPKYCKDNNLTAKNMYQVASGTKGHHQNYKCQYADSNKGAVKEYVKVIHKTYILTNPEGEEITVTNLKEFCKEKDLVYSNIHSVIQGRAKTHKGWCGRYA